MRFFKRVTWGREPVSTSKLNDMVQNDDYLNEKMLSGVYEVLGVTRDTGLNFRAGYIKVPTSKNTHHYFKYNYAKPFLPGTRPVVLTSIATDWRCRFFVGVRGLDGRAIPDHRGFELLCSQVSEQPGVVSEFEGDQYISYLAIAPSSI